MMTHFPADQQFAELLNHVTSFGELDCITIQFIPAGAPLYFVTPILADLTSFSIFEWKFASVDPLEGMLTVKMDSGVKVCMTFDFLNMWRENPSGAFGAVRVFETASAATKYLALLEEFVGNPQLLKKMNLDIDANVVVINSNSSPQEVTSPRDLSKNERQQLREWLSWITDARGNKWA